MEQVVAFKSEEHPYECVRIGKYIYMYREMLSSLLFFDYFFNLNEF